MVVVFSTGFLVENVDAAWWDTNWDYFKTITISNKVDDYQTFINITKSSGGDVDCEGNCQDDFDDIRFVYNNATELPYWIESYVSGSYAYFWVKNTGNYDNFDMFYGNSGVSDNSDGDNTFIFFDDFSGNLDKWTTQGSPAIVSGNAELDNDDYIYSDNKYPAFDRRIRDSAKANEQDISLIGRNEANDKSTTNRISIKNSDGSGYDQDLSHITLESRADATGTTTKNQACDAVTNFNTYQIDSTSSNNKFYQNDVLKATHTTNLPDGDSYVYLYTWDSSQESKLTVDWIFLSLYDATEPSFSFSGEVQQGGGWSNSAPTITNPNPTNGATDTELTPTINATVWDVDGNDTTVDFWYSTDDITFYHSGAVQSGHSANTSASQTASFASAYGTKYYWNMTAYDGHDNTTSSTWNFTTIDYTPDAPSSFSASADSDVQISLSWSDDTEADTTRLEWSTDNEPVWNVGDYTLLQNDSSESYTHSSLDCGEDYFYKVWSWNSTQGVWSSGSTDDETTNSCPVWHSESFGGSVTVSFTPLLSFTIVCSSGSGSDEFHFRDWNLGVTGVGYTNQENVSEDNQTGSVPALNISNTGNVALNFTMYWVSDPGSGISMKYATSDSAPNPDANLIGVEEANETLIISNLGVSAYEEIWLWMDFISVSSGSGEVDVTIVSSEYGG